MQAEDLIEIHQLMSLYGHVMDAPDSDLISQVFADDAAVDERQFGLGLYDGIEAIKDWHRRAQEASPPAHQTTNVFVYEQNGQTRVKGKFFVFRPSDGHPILGDYDDIVVKTERGWRIKYRSMTMTYPSAIPHDFQTAPI